jgi:multidrug efflux system membrane fusion protein
MALSAAITLGACAPPGQTQAPAGGGRGTQDAVIPITTARVEQRTIQLDIRVIGSVEPSQTVAVRAQTTGDLVAVNFKEGDDVQKGQVLFELDRRPLEAALDQAQANLDRDVATALNAKSSAARYQDLLQRGIATREQADQSRTSATALDATVEADRAAVANARVQLQYATIRAPFSGRTGSLMVHLGNLVRANDLAPLVVLNQVAPLNVVFSIPENRLLELKRYLSKGTLKVEAAPPDDDGPPSSGAITFVDNAVDPTTGSIKIKGSFPNTNRHLWPGQFVNVIVALSTVPNAVVVPAAAVLTGQRGPYVVVVKADKTVEFRSVKVTRTVDDETVVSDGLKGGETVVTDGHIRLVPGSRVSIKASPGPQGSKDAP